MKKIITAMLVCALFAAVSSEAQTTQPMMKKHAMHGARMQQMLKDSLHLTDVQIDSVTAIREQNMGTMLSIRNDTALSTEQRQEQIKAAREQMKTRLKSVLSEEQMKQLEEMQRNMHRGAMKNSNN